MGSLLQYKRASWRGEDEGRNAEQAEGGIKEARRRMLGYEEVYREDPCWS